MEYFSAARMRCVHAYTVCKRSTRARLRGVTFGRIPVIVSRIVEPIRATRTRSRNVTFYLRDDSRKAKSAGRFCSRTESEELLPPPLSLSLSSSLPDSTSHPANAFAVPLWASRCETASVAYQARGYFDREREGSFGDTSNARDAIRSKRARGTRARGDEG